MVREVLIAVEKNSFEQFNNSMWKQGFEGMKAIERLKPTAMNDNEMANTLKNDLLVQIQSIVSGKKVSTEGLEMAVDLEQIIKRLRLESMGSRN